MSKIKVTQVFFTEGSEIFVTDDKGRLWKEVNIGEWKQIELPEDN